MGRHALVIGAGIGGLAAAIGLRRAGWSVEVHERAPELTAAGAGLSLWTNALRALDLLGPGDEVRASGFAPDGGALRTRDGEVLSAFGDDAMPPGAGALMVGIHRAALQAILLRHAGPEVVRCGRELVGFDEDAEGVTAHFGDGATARGDVLVGADGLRSVVRAGLHGTAAPRYAGYTAWRAVVPFDAAEALPGESWGRGMRFGRVPLDAGRVYWFATRDAAEGERAPDGEKAELLRLFGGWHDPIPALLAATDEGAILRNDIYDRPPLRRWGRGRVTLLGDAAHPMTPDLGQGACQALEDAAVLAESLARPGDAAEALRRYEARRIPRTTRFVRRSRGVGRVGQWSHPLATGLRTVVTRHLLARLQPGEMGRLATEAW